MPMIAAWCLKYAIADVLSATLSKCEGMCKNTLAPNYTIIANLTADVKLFFKKPSAVRKRYDPKIVSTSDIRPLEALNYGKQNGFAVFDT